MSATTATKETTVNEHAAKRNYTIAVDFDGVIHSYLTPWVNAETIPDPPIPGAIEWLNKMREKFEVVIFTTRGKTAEGRVAVQDYLFAHGWTGDEIPNVTAEKPPALIYLDDRAMRFAGAYPTADEIHAARPWKASALKDATAPGATGDFPRGKLTEEDEGGLRVAMAATRGSVVIDFGKPVAWLGLGPKEARAMAATLLKKADEAEAS